MKSSVFSILIFTCPIIAFAQIPEGLPHPDSGVQVVPLSSMYQSQSIRNQKLRRLESQKNLGYIETKEPYVTHLLTLKNHSSQEIKEFKGNPNPYDTHLKESIDEIKLAFAYKGLSNIDHEKVIGFAAIGSWENGWTGVKEFFESKDLGICEFSKSNRNLSHGGIQIAADFARYDINSMPNILNVKGNKLDGFLYTIIWHDSTFNNDLECANINYDKNITNNLIKFAMAVDKSEK